MTYAVRFALGVAVAAFLGVMVLSASDTPTCGTGACIMTGSWTGVVAHPYLRHQSNDDDE